eukprot:8294452-Pyramimonas_sp.AAC.1
MSRLFPRIQVNLGSMVKGVWEIPKVSIRLFGSRAQLASLRQARTLGSDNEAKVKTRTCGPFAAPGEVTPFEDRSTLSVAIGSNEGRLISIRSRASLEYNRRRHRERGHATDPAPRGHGNPSPGSCRRKRQEARCPGGHGGVPEAAGGHPRTGGGQPRGVSRSTRHWRGSPSPDGHWQRPVGRS